MKTLELSVSEERSSNDVLSCRRDGISFAFKNKRGNGSVGVVVVQASAFDLFELNHLRRIVHGRNLSRTSENFGLRGTNMAEPPYGIICNRLKAGRVIPFLGAGASFVERPPGGKWEASEPLFLPSGLELAEFLAEEAEFPSTDPSDICKWQRR